MKAAKLAPQFQTDYLTFFPLRNETLPPIAFDTASKKELEEATLFAVYLKEGNHFIGVMGFSPSTHTLYCRMLPLYHFMTLAVDGMCSLIDWLFKKTDRDQLIFSPKGDEGLTLAKTLGLRPLNETTFFLKRIKLLPYDPNWKAVFEKEKQALLNIFQVLPIALYHIGSTSIPGSISKPIIDIIGVVANLRETIPYLQGCIEEGYQTTWNSNVPSNYIILLKPSTETTLEILFTIYEDDHVEISRLLRFRNYLRSHPKTLATYNQLKERNVLDNSWQINSYAQAKYNWVKEIDCKAALDETPIDPIPYLGEKQKDWTSDEKIRAFEANRKAKAFYFPLFMPMVDVVFCDILALQSPIKHPDFNQVVCSSLSFDAFGKEIDTQLKAFQQANTPFAWWAGPFDTPSTLSFELKVRNLKKENYRVLFLKQRDLHCTSLNTDLILQCVKAQESSLHIPPLLYREGAPYERVVSTSNHDPICSAILFYHANMCVISSLKTKLDTAPQFLLLLDQHIKKMGYFLTALFIEENQMSKFESLAFEEGPLYEKYFSKEEKNGE